MKRIIYLISFICVAVGLYYYVNQIALQSNKVLRVWVNESDYEVLNALTPPLKKSMTWKLN